ncbi:conserved hypothetical protein [Vibrio aestuarianus]|uniref:hypothetical protein n=1 Tax=Vibrio TaxID=662 RepID=UPI001455E6E2|nr:hypothetical protein [Vibrio aestuarianus]EGQ9892832.1 hypothetical protein [Vibrio cholerae]EJL6633717.1 hypothetical protein [Vibrio cholerae]NLS63596.1 hypothetical protein [Vibrio aestuarianus subsp. francensis]CAH8188627.1 conserved hypothetical protein [Vibrio aestuarianus]
MKIWAYVTDKNQKPIPGKQDHSQLMMYIWEALKLKRDHGSEFNNFILWSTHRDPRERKPVHPNKNGFFRYYPKNSAKEVQGDSDGESLSHQLAIEALTSLSTIPFKIGNRDLSLKFEYFDKDYQSTRLQFGSDKYFYPDAIGYLSKDSPMYDEWGGKVALEIFVTHSCEPDKVKAFESHNIPILEVKIADSIRFRKELNKQAFTPEDLEDYFEKLRAIFSQQVFAKILSDPLVTQYSRAIIKKLRWALDSSNDKMSHVARDITLLERESARYKQHLEQLKISKKQELDSFQRSLLEMQGSFEQSKLDLHQQYQSQLRISKFYTVVGVVFAGVLTTLMLFLLALPHINYELAARLVVDYFNWVKH